VDQLRAANGNGPVPVDLVTTSASGLDPEISPAAAEYQVARIAAARGIGESAVRTVIARHTEQPLFGFLGEARVNVLLVNLDLEGLLR
jgi:K+-transporting ATPase ATPase C chain